ACCAAPPAALRPACPVPPDRDRSPRGRWPTGIPAPRPAPPHCAEDRPWPAVPGCGTDDRARPPAANPPPARQRSAPCGDPAIVLPRRPGFQLPGSGMTDTVPTLLDLAQQPRHRVEHGRIILQSSLTQALLHEGVQII